MVCRSPSRSLGKQGSEERCCGSGSRGTCQGAGITGGSVRDRAREGTQAGSCAAGVRQQIARPSYLTNGIRSAGTLLANEEVDIVSKVSGKVTGVFFKEGSVVKKGALLVKIYDEDLQAQLRRSEIQEKMLSEKLERQRVLLVKGCCEPRSLRPVADRL
ncbi:MAG: biotin/lipoyl-binding protein [Marinilabiliales bacterium]|nr:biotin/lipoyl-binding protein [Marinilabiliales bacterium]